MAFIFQALGLTKLEPFYEAFSIFFSTFLVTVATILGTGILALPVKLSASGFWPFVLTFTICLFAQIAIVLFMVELLQKAHALSSKETMIRLDDVGDAFMNEMNDTITGDVSMQSVDSFGSLSESDSDMFILEDSALQERKQKQSHWKRTKTQESLSKRKLHTKSNSFSAHDDSGIFLDISTRKEPLDSIQIPNFESTNDKMNFINYSNEESQTESNIQVEITASEHKGEATNDILPEMDSHPNYDIKHEQSHTNQNIEVTVAEVTDDLPLDDISLDILTRNNSPQSSPTHNDIIHGDKVVTSHGNKLLSAGPDLHSMSNQFLPHALRLAFELSVIGHFLSILISYGLAGPKAIAQIFGLGDYFQFLIPIFIIFLAGVVVFGSRLIHIIISWATLFKGMLLVTMVIVVGLISTYVNQSPHDNWQFVGRPFLISTIALGGTCNTIPIIFSSMTRNGTPSKIKIYFFQFGAVLGVFSCFLINILWCLFILRIVPQTGGSVSLEHAEENGDISTVGLVKVISSTPSLSGYYWIGSLVEIFISTSIAVSFVTMSSGLKHVLDGYVKSFKKIGQQDSSAIRGISSRIVKRIMTILQKVTRFPGTVIQLSLYILFFGTILIMALLNPKSFFIVMEVFASLALNLESGFFITLMFFISRTYNVPIPVKLPRIAIAIAILVVTYFSFAVLYDLLYSTLRMTLYLVKTGDYEIPF